MSRRSSSTRGTPHACDSEGLDGVYRQGVGARLRFAPRARTVGQMAGDAKSRLRGPLRGEQGFGLKVVLRPSAGEQDDVADASFAATHCADESDRPEAPPPVAR